MTEEEADFAKYRPKVTEVTEVHAAQGWSIGDDIVSLLVRIQPSLKAAAEKAAADDHRSLSSLIEKMAQALMAAWPAQ